MAKLSTERSQQNKFQSEAEVKVKGTEEMALEKVRVLQVELEK